MYKIELKDDILHELWLLKEKTSVPIKQWVEIFVTRGLRQEKSLKQVREIMKEAAQK